MVIEMPKAAEAIIKTLSRAGYSAYIVGGSVRDSLLSRAPGDFDITTSARPEEVKGLFERTVDTGIAHGTVTVIIGGEPFEVTTFRVDGEYKDSRHPESVSFTATVDGDLARRDFTVNAMAYNHREGLIDLFGGRDDLENKVIRAVGDPRVRFSEDALRILRALRFCSVLDFEIEEQTRAAIFELFPTLDKISGERILQEFKKLVAGKGAYKILTEYGKVLDSFIPGFSSIALPERERFDMLSPEHRLALILSEIGIDALAAVKQRLRLDNKTFLLAEAAIKGGLPSGVSTPELGEFLTRMKDADAIAAAAIGEALGKLPNGAHSKIEQLIAEDFPRTVRHLKVDGAEISRLGFFGKEISEAQSKALLAVARGEIANEREALVEFLKSLKD